MHDSMVAKELLVLYCYYSRSVCSCVKMVCLCWNSWCYLCLFCMELKMEFWILYKLLDE